MSMDLARKDFSTAPKYFIAGVDIGIAKATKTASEAVEAHAPVLIADGKVMLQQNTERRVRQLIANAKRKGVI